MALPTGTKLGPYEIVTPIGSGGMGDVYRARDTRLDRDVALKVLPERVAKDAEARMRFEREAKAVAALTHPNILAIHDYGSHEGAAYHVTELLEGQTLRHRITEGPLPWRKAVEIGAAIADGLAAAHAKGIIHRDLKPENIFLTGDGRVKILDFGIAQLVAEPVQDEIDPALALTAPMKTDPHAVVGTAGYMAPEQLRGEKVDPTTDIFSLGALLYEMVTGKAAFIRGTVIDSLSAILSDTPDVFAVSDRMIPYELARVIQRCLEKNRAERFQSARDLAFALRAIGTSGSITFEAPAERKRRRVIVAIVLAIVLLGTAAALLLLTQNQPFTLSTRSLARRVTGQPRSLAILPFVNGTGDADAEYLSDGITETLINTLARVPGLRVMSRTSVFHYKGRPANPVSVGHELHVGAVVVGRVEEVGNRLVVSAELIDTSDNSLIWGNRYQASRADLFSVQQSIASEIARMLRIQLGGREQQMLAKRHTADPHAYELYLKGRFQWNKRDAQGLYKAIEYFNQAIEIDPQYALAYAGLADCYNLLDIWAGLPTNETFPRAKAAAQKALSIDDELAEAHTSLAYAIHTYEWDWPAAEREYRRAIALNPNYATARQWYAEFLTANGRFKEAEVQGNKALELDPMSPIINAVVAWNLTMARKYDAAIEQGIRTTQLFPQFMPGHAYLGLAYLESGHAREAIAPFTTARKELDIPVFVTWLARAHLAAGDRAAAEKLLRELQRKHEYLPAYYMACLYAHLGDRDHAFRELDRALTERTGAMVWVRVDPALDPLRKDTRFARFGTPTASSAEHAASRRPPGAGRSTTQPP